MLEWDFCLHKCNGSMFYWYLKSARRKWEKCWPETFTYNINFGRIQTVAGKKNNTILGNNIWVSDGNSAVFVIQIDSVTKVLEMKKIHFGLTLQQAEIT